MNVYFISGMCINCSIFDGLILPSGYDKKYIEWLNPQNDESLTSYSQRMAKSIDSSKPFILIGYSFGAVIMQEINRFLTPVKNIVISSMKSRNEIPSLFRFARKIHFAEHFPKRLLNNDTDVITNIFTHLTYSVSVNGLEQYIGCTSSDYMRWAVQQITNWTPSVKCKNLFHIHGTKDQIFPPQKIKDAYMIEDGDHLMILKKTKEVNKILNDILLMK